MGVGQRFTEILPGGKARGNQVCTLHIGAGHDFVKRVELFLQINFRGGVVLPDEPTQSVCLGKENQVFRAQAAVKELAEALSAGTLGCHDVGAHMQLHHIGNVAMQLFFWVILDRKASVRGSPASS